MNSTSIEYPKSHNIGGYADSFLNTWLNETIYNSMDADLKTIIQQTTITCTDGNNNPNGTKTSKCYLFLPSVKEVGFEDDISGDYPYMDAINKEGTVFDWFANGGQISDKFWLRSSSSTYDTDFFRYDNGNIQVAQAYGGHMLYPVFIIG